MKKYVLTIFFILFYNEVNSSQINVLKMSCEYDPKLIRKEQKELGFLDDEKIDRKEICKILKCKDVIEVNTETSKNNDNNSYRLRNSWFNHQGILIDDFLMTENSLTINTFVSQAFFLESYFINRLNGKTKRIFYRFDYPELFYHIKKIEKEKNKKLSIYNENGKLSLKTLKKLSLNPLETIYFEGECLEGIGI